MKYYTIEDNKDVIFAGDVNDGKNDIVKYFVKRSDGSYREFPNNDANADFRCFSALKAGTLQTFTTLEQAKN
jgi:hypothetical protein